jgi:NAD(P)H-hydrate epimerase
MPVGESGTVEYGLPREVVRTIDRLAMDELGLPGLVLMENAGRGVVDLLERLGIDAPVAIVCGKGNNGGDGFVIARHLALRGRSCRVLTCFPESDLTGDAQVNYRVLCASRVPITRLAELGSGEGVFGWLQGCGWIVDALLGTGATGAPRDPLPEVIAAINHRGGRVLAIDVPSGLDAETGEAGGACVRALRTATFVSPKLGFARSSARRFTGVVSVLPIGVPAQWLERTLVRLGASEHA